MTQHYKFPTAKEIDNLHSKAIEMRNEAIRDSFVAFVSSVRSTFASVLGRKSVNRNQNA